MTTKFCNGCRRRRAIGKFGSNGSGKIRSRCKECHNNEQKSRRSKEPERWLKYSKEYYAKNSTKLRKKSSEYARNNPRSVRNSVLLHHYGITVDEYDKMYSDQDGECCWCSTYHDTLCVDHDHDTNKIRGLLCHHCNRLVGQVEKRGVDMLLVYLGFDVELLDGQNHQRKQKEISKA